MNEELMQLIQVKRAWTEAAKCAEKEGSIVAAEYARHMVKECSKKIVRMVAENAKKGDAQ